MAPLKRPPQKQAKGNRGQVDTILTPQVNNTRPQAHSQKTSQANSLQKALLGSSNVPIPTGKYPCLICTHRATFPTAPNPPKIGRVNITWAQVIRAKYEYDLANIHCSTCSTHFSTIIGQSSTENDVYERWRWAVGTFGNCQYILEYASCEGRAGKWRYALSVDYLHCFGEESDEDEWSGYPDVIEIWETDDDQEGAVFVVEPLEMRDPGRAAHLAALARGMREADDMEKRLLDAAEKAKVKKVEPRELTWEERRKERRREREQERRNDEEDRLRDKKYDALKRRGGLTDEEIMDTIAGDRAKRQEKEAKAAKMGKKSHAEIQAERIAAAEQEIKWIDEQDTGELDDDGQEIAKEPEEPKEPKYKQRKEGETDQMYEKRVSRADKTAATKTAKKLQRELEQQQAAGQDIAQSGSNTVPEAQQTPANTAYPSDPPAKNPPAKNPPAKNPPAKNPPAKNPPAKNLQGGKQTDARKEGESDKQYKSRMVKVAAQARMKEAKLRAQQSAVGGASAHTGDTPSQTMNKAPSEAQSSQSKPTQKGNGTQPKKSPAKRKRKDDSEEGDNGVVVTEKGGPGEEGNDTEDATAIDQGSPTKKRKRGPRKPKKQPGAPISFF